VDDDHYYKVHVEGYVIVKLPKKSAKEVITEAVERAVDDGMVAMTSHTVDEEWDEQ
jgi:hypothetical protein